MKLTKKQEAEYNMLRDKLENEIINANASIIAAQEARAAFEEFRDGVYGEIESFIDDKSDRWREGEAGAAHDAWKDEWSEEICAEIPEEIEPELREYPMEPEG